MLRAHDLMRRSGLPPLQIQAAGKGSHHDLFVIELDEGPLRLLRIPSDRRAEKVSKWLRAEEEAIRRASARIEVPHPTLLIPSLDRAEGSIMPIVEGIRAHDLREDGLDSPTIAQLCALLAQTLARLHSLEYPVHEPTSIPFFSPSFLTGGERLLHGDAHLGNLMVAEDKPGHWHVSAMIDWSFCHWGPPEGDLVEMAITEAERRPALGHHFLNAYKEAGGFEIREPVFKWALMRELDRRLNSHAQAYEQNARDAWTRWLAALHRPDAHALRVFDPNRAPGAQLV